jgi:adiponectin receptor
MTSTETISNDSSMVRQRRKVQQSKHSRKPSEAPGDSENIEDVVLHKVDNFLYNLESKLDELEEYGLQKLEDIDESVHLAYKVLQQVRDEAIGEGKRRAESLLHIVDRHYPTVVLDETKQVSSKLFNGIVALEEKLSHVEETCKWVTKQQLDEALAKAKHRLLNADDLPAPWRESINILQGYRFTERYVDCVVSVCQVHNETCNIWSHLLGFGLVAYLFFYDLPSTQWWLTATALDKFTIGFYMMSAMNAMICSATWHAFSCLCMRQVKQKFACVDYSGITMLIAATIVTCEYMSMYCQTTVRNAFMIVTSLCGLGGATFTWAPDFDKPQSRGKRIFFFVSFAVAGVSSFFTAAFIHGFWKTFFFYLPIMKSLLTYIGGVTFYGLQIPEKWYPGTIFDYIGASHNLWHIAVVAAIYFHYNAMMGMLPNAAQYSCGVSH